MLTIGNLDGQNFDYSSNYTLKKECIEICDNIIEKHGNRPECQDDIQMFKQTRRSLICETLHLIEHEIRGLSSSDESIDRRKGLYQMSNDYKEELNRIDGFSFVPSNSWAKILHLSSRFHRGQIQKEAIWLDISFSSVEEWAPPEFINENKNVKVKVKVKKGILVVQSTGENTWISPNTLYECDIFREEAETGYLCKLKVKSPDYPAIREATWEISCDKDDKSYLDGKCYDLSIAKLIRQSRQNQFTIRCEFQVQNSEEDFDWIVTENGQPTKKRKKYTATLFRWAVEKIISNFPVGNGLATIASGVVTYN